MIARRLLSPPVIIGFLLVAAVAVAGGFITSPLSIDTTVWSDFVASRTPAMNSFMTGASWRDTSTGETGQMREHSRFSRRAGRWVYEYGAND